MDLVRPTAGGAARIGVVDDHAAVNLGVAALLAGLDDLVLVGAAPTVDVLLEAAPALDLVVLDLSLGDASTPAANVARLVEAGARVLAYTSGAEARLVRECARAGVVGVIRKSAAPEVLVAAIRAALRGEVVATADWAAAIDADVHSAGLTVRERQVLELYASGEKADRVARVLGISRETVLDHVRRIRVKYAAVDRAAPTKVDLYRRAVEDGMIPPAG